MIETLKNLYAVQKQALKNNDMFLLNETNKKIFAIRQVLEKEKRQAKEKEKEKLIDKNICEKLKGVEKC